MKKAVDRITSLLTCSLMLVMVLVACWQVFTRFVLNAPSAVSEEFLRYALIWLTMVGAAYAYGKKKHLAVVFVARKVPKKFQIYVQLIVEAFVLLFIVVILLFGGVKASQNAMGQFSSALGIPMEYLYLSLIVSGVLFLFYSIIHIKDYFTKNGQIPEEDEIETY